MKNITYEQLKLQAYMKHSKFGQITIFMVGLVWLSNILQTSQNRASRSLPRILCASCTFALSVFQYGKIAPPYSKITLPTPPPLKFLL